MAEVMVEVFELTDGEWEMTIPEFFKWIEEAVAEVPEEFRDKIIIKATEADSDNLRVDINASYTRPETEEEIQEKAEHQRRYDEETEASERRRYEQLKAKFG